MRPVSDRDYTLSCPMPDCDEALYLTWMYSYGLYQEDLLPTTPLVEADAAHSGTWQVHCVGGHVLLLPANEVDGVEHFTETDRKRLRELLDRLAGERR